MQLVYLAPLYFVPLYWLNVIAMYTYIYVLGVLDHSGINFQRQWWQPWQPDVVFHDDHHKLTIINFGTNLELWDVVHGTAK